MNGKKLIIRPVTFNETECVLKVRAKEFISHCNDMGTRLGFKFARTALSSFEQINLYSVVWQFLGAKSCLFGVIIFALN